MLQLISNPKVEEGAFCAIPIKEYFSDQRRPELPIIIVRITIYGG
jgi:hypothetical protein